MSQQGFEPVVSEGSHCEAAADSICAPQETSESRATGDTIVIDSPRDATFLKQIAKTVEIPKVVPQNGAPFSSSRKG